MDLSRQSHAKDRVVNRLGWVLLHIILSFSVLALAGCLRNDPEPSRTPPQSTRIVVDKIAPFVPPPKPTSRTVRLPPTPTPAPWSYRDIDLGIAFPIPRGYTVSRRSVQGFSGITSLELVDHTGNSIHLVVDVHGDYESALENVFVFWKGGWWCSDRGGRSDTYPVEAKNGRGLWCFALVGIHNEHGYAGLGSTGRAVIGGTNSVVVKVSTSTGEALEPFKLLIGGFEFLTSAEAQ